MLGKCKFHSLRDTSISEKHFCSTTVQTYALDIYIGAESTPWLDVCKTNEYSPTILSENSKDICRLQFKDSRFYFWNNITVNRKPLESGIWFQVENPQPIKINIVRKFCDLKTTKKRFDW